MTINEQLHTSATHKAGPDSNCPACTDALTMATTLCDDFARNCPLDPTDARTPLVRALAVFLFDARLRTMLLKADPQAVIQACRAVRGVMATAATADAPIPPQGDWKVLHRGQGRGKVATRVDLGDGRGINFSGRLSDAQAITSAASQIADWTTLGMVTEALAAFQHWSQE